MDDQTLVGLVARLRRNRTDDATTEVKGSQASLSKDVWDSVSAFANTRGGVLILGLSESAGFTPVGGFAIDKVRDQFVDGMGRGNSSGGKLTNPPSFEISRLELEEEPVLVIEIAENDPSTKPCFVTAKGLVNGGYRRIDDKNIRLTPSELFELQHVYEASRTDREVVSDARIDDLDQHLLQQLVAAKSESKALAGIQSKAEQFARLNVTDRDGGIRLAALLALGRFPQQFMPRLLVDVVVHPTVEAPSASRQLRFLDRVECEGPLPEVVDQAVAAVRKNLRTYSVVEGVGRRDYLEIPIGVIREAIANAVLHRQYHPMFQGQPVSVDVHPDRVVVTSPGGLWGGKTIETLDDGESRCRNQTLLQLLQGVPLTAGEGMVAEGEGGGIRMMNDLMAAQALDRPDYSGTGPDAVRVVLRRHGAEVPELRHWLRSNVSRPVTPAEETAVIIAKREGTVDVPTLHQALGADSDEVRAILRGLLGDGILRLQGPEVYGLNDGSPALSGAPLDVLNVLSPTEPLSMKDIAAATGRNVNSLRHVVRRLVNEGRVIATAPPSSRHRRYLRAR